MSPVRRLTIIGVALLVVAGVAVVAVNLGSGIGEVVATPSPTPVASAGRPSASADEDVMAVLREIEAQVIAIRDLPAADVGPPEIITRAQLADELTRIFEEGYPPEDRERDTLALRALGLLGPDDDIFDLQLQLLGDQVLGFYDDVDRRMVIVSDAGLTAEAKMTYAHEYAHALQDAAFDFDTLETDAAGEDDRALARTALIEGDASVVMLAWAFEYLSAEELLEIGMGPALPDMTGIPAWMVAQLAFPYEDGLTWASTLVGNPLASPDFGPIDAAFADPPDSTEQIIHLGAWEPREDPVPVDQIDLVTALGDGWDMVDATPIGEAFIAIILEYHGVSRATARGAAAGWGGDRASIASGPDGAFAVAWRLAWDTPADAEEFASAYEQISGTLGFPASVERLADGDVLVVHASDENVRARTIEVAGE